MERHFEKGRETANSESGPKKNFRQEKSGTMLFTGLLFIEKSSGGTVFQDPCHR
jgi:hypothetical protein